MGPPPRTVVRSVRAWGCVWGPQWVQHFQAIAKPAPIHPHRGGVRGQQGRGSGDVYTFVFCGLSFKTSIRKLAMAAQACNLSAPEVEARRQQV